MFDRTKLRSAAARLLYNDDRDTRDYDLLVEFIDAMCIDPQGNIRLDHYQQKCAELENLLAMARAERDAVTKRVIELEPIVAQQRQRAQLAEDFICMQCTECNSTVTDGIWTGVKSCCSTFPECGRFKSRHIGNIEAIRMRYVAADCKGVEKSILADVLRLLEEEVTL